MKRRRYVKVLSAVFGNAWAIQPAKLQEIIGVLDLRERGAGLTRRELEARFGSVEHPPLVDYFGPDDSGGASPTSVTAQPRIAVLNLFGTIAQRMNLMMEFSGGTSTEMFGKAFEQAVEDESVTAIIINVDSPGGTVAGTRELAETIYEARGTKPIVAVANPMMASAAYWIASAADELVATPSANGIGSIGVIQLHREESKANAQAGITYTLIRSVENKADHNPWEPLSDAARTHIAGEIARLHADFRAAVARNRGMAVADVDEQFGEGRDYIAENALRLGLVDRIATLEDVIAGLVPDDAETNEPNAAARGRVIASRKAAKAQRSRGMDPKIKLALVQAGLAQVGQTDEQYQAALDLFYEAKGAEQPEDAAHIVRDLQASRETSLETGSESGAEDGPRNHPKQTLSALEIMGLVQTAGASLAPEAQLKLTKELVQKVAAGDLTLSGVLDRINEEVRAANKPAGPSIEVAADARDKFEARARDAILCASWNGSYPEQILDYRSGAMVDWKPAGAEREFGLMSPIKIGMQCLIMAGFPANKVLGLSKAQVAQLICGARPDQIGLGGILASSDGPAYNVTGMFSNIFLDAANVLLRRSYNDGRTTFQIWMRQGPSLEDFKPVHKVIAGELGDPKAIPEDGTFEETTLTDGKEQYKLTVWGQILSHSWQIMVNDRLGSFTEMPMKLGRAMRRKENRLAYGVVKDNANLSDSQPLFDNTAHTNVTTGALSTVADYVGAWNTMAQKLAEQKGLNTESGALNLMARWCVFPPAIRGIILQALRSMSSDTTNPGIVNIWEGQLVPVEEAELGAAFGGSDTAFYHATDPMDVDTIEYAFLQGLEAPRIEQETAFDRLAVRQRIYHAFGVKALDYRGLQQHTGAA